MKKPLQIAIFLFTVALGEGVVASMNAAGRTSGGALLAITAVFLDLALTFQVLRRKSLISFSLSLIPPILLWLFFLGGNCLWIALSVAVSAALFFIYRGRLPETRGTTDAWMGSLVLTILCCLTPFIVTSFLK